MLRARARARVKPSGVDGLYFAIYRRDHGGIIVGIPVAEGPGSRSSLCSKAATGKSCVLLFLIDFAAENLSFCFLSSCSTVRRG